MNKNEYQKPKSRSSFKLNDNIIEKKQKEIKSSLNKDLFLTKKKTFNKSKLDFISKQQQIIRGNSRESQEKKIFLNRPKTHKNNYENNNINIQSINNSPRVRKSVNNLYNNKSRLIFNLNVQISSWRPELKRQQLFPKLESKSQSRQSPNFTYLIRGKSKYENNDYKYKTKNAFFNFRNNIKLVEKKDDYYEKNNQNSSNNSSYFKINNNYNSVNNFYYKKYKYIIRPENCGYLIKKCFKHRINWVELPDLFDKDFHFKWQQNTRNLNFSSLSKVGHFKQMVNHYEYHSVITNKANLFLNLMKHAEIAEENVFKYIPFTVLFEFGSDKFYLMMENFEKLFNNIEKYLVDFEDMDANRYKFYKNRIYSNLFPFEDHLGSKTAINVPNTHINVVQYNINDKKNKNENEKNGNKIIKNLWLVKAPDLNRGLCIQVVDNINLIKKHISNYYKGIDKRYNKGENYKNMNQLSFLDEANNSNDIRSSYSSNYKKDMYELTENAYHKYRSGLIVVQKYIERPLLYFGRKFDIRIWVLLTHDFKVYMFNEGHLKCCSVQYDLNINNSFSHLTNYSFQKYNDNFGKYEKGNEVSFDDLQYNIQVNYNNSIDFKDEVIPKIKKIIKFVFQSVKNKINGLNRNYTFEIYGFDFMLDINYNPFLIEVNFNPGLEESSPLIKMLVPRMLDDALRLTVDKEFDTIYSFKGVERRASDCDYLYESPFPVNGYTNNENLFRFICDLNLEEGTNKKTTKFRYLRIKTKKNSVTNNFF